MQETWDQSLGQEDPLEKGMTTHSGILAWENPWTKEPGRLRFMSYKEWDTTMAKPGPQQLGFLPHHS